MRLEEWSRAARVLQVLMNNSRQRRNHAAWIGPLLALLGLVSYFVWAARYPSLRDSAWLNLLLVAAGTSIAVWAVVKRSNWKSWVGVAAAAGLTCLLFGYVFVLSSQIPSAETAVAVGAPAPPVDLLDHAGQMVSLGDYLGRRVVVVFYRGFW